jgi:hypothetical protein
MASTIDKTATRGKKSLEAMMPCDPPRKLLMIDISKRRSMAFALYKHRHRLAGTAVHRFTR